MIDFILFDTLISRQALLVFYYLGAVVMPLSAWLTALYVMRRLPPVRDAYRVGMNLMTRHIPLRWRLFGFSMFMLSFLFMELMWRMMFEYLIAFMQMRDALVSGCG